MLSGKLSRILANYIADLLLRVIRMELGVNTWRPHARNPFCPSWSTFRKVDVGDAIVKVPTIAASKYFSSDLQFVKTLFLLRRDVDFYFGDRTLQIQEVLQRENFNAVAVTRQRFSQFQKTSYPDYNPRVLVHNFRQA